MIILLATCYQKHIAYLLFLLFSCTLPTVNATGFTQREFHSSKPAEYRHAKTRAIVKINPVVVEENQAKASGNISSNASVFHKGNKQKTSFIDGPNAPEMASFKSVGANNMVNLFTGDFSYNIPLLDVGGYPVNIFYNGGITMDQEASWVGLGWNINPGTISRNMRGLPDDYNGVDEITKEQSMRQDLTVGVNGGKEWEILGTPFAANANVGIFYNNRRGIGLEGGIGGEFTI